MAGFEPELSNTVRRCIIKYQPIYWIIGRQWVKRIYDILEKYINPTYNLQ